MAALSTTLTLPSPASVTVFSRSCLPSILLCSCQKALASSLRTAAKFSGFICWAPFLPPLRHLIELTLNNIFIPLPWCTHCSDADHRQPSAGVCISPATVRHAQSLRETAPTPVTLITICLLMTPNHIPSFNLLSPGYLTQE